MFPNAGSVIYYNEAGEVLGWDNPSYYEPEYNPDDYLNFNAEVYGDDDEIYGDDDE